MNRDEVSRTIRGQLGNQLQVDIDEVEETSLLINDLDADSIDLLELVLALRDHFGITIEEGEVKALLAELARFVPDAGNVAGELTDTDLAEVSRRLRVSTIIDFVMSKNGDGTP